MGSNGYGRGGDREGLIRAYDEEENMGFGLTDLTEDTDEEGDHRGTNGKANGRPNGTPVGNGSAKRSSLVEPIERSRSRGSRGSRVSSPR